ncbi:MAG: hypothetical protein Q4D98_03640, partial [Planctomycetia bacterium]|nr:hypothetical protein [Planctomycetia bacterium]
FVKRNFLRVGKQAEKKGAKHARRKSKAVFGGGWYKTITYPKSVVLRVAKSLYSCGFRCCKKVQNVYIPLLRISPFCSLGEVGGAGRAAPQRLTITAAVVKPVLP